LLDDAFNPLATLASTLLTFNFISGSLDVVDTSTDVSGQARITVRPIDTPVPLPSVMVLLALGIALTQLRRRQSR
jgi:hypothetical protein